MMVGRQQQRSKTIFRGPPPDHELAVQKVQWFLDTRKRKQEWEIDNSVDFYFGVEFRKQLPTNKTFMGHCGDLGIFEKVVDMAFSIDANKPTWKLKALIEIGGNVGFWYINPFTNKPTKASPTKHSKKIQQRNDKIIKNWCEKNDVKYITLLKEEILGDCKADKEYWLTGLRHLEEHPDLQEWIK